MHSFRWAVHTLISTGAILTLKSQRLPVTSYPINTKISSSFSPCFCITCILYFISLYITYSFFLLTPIWCLQKLKAIEQLKEQAAAGKQLEKNQVFSAFFIRVHSYYHPSPFYYKKLFNQIKEYIDF